ncbi:hypothetical protein WA026_002164 [Henosepilachna vigintioctopunctata]|uniref:Uncharacterized protein n=1 Tax=Henosepilachna vigintioctopunctata TaxID=420089 RepID=A0AAW1TU47_9CUCU
MQNVFGKNNIRTSCLQYKRSDVGPKKQNHLRQSQKKLHRMSKVFVFILFGLLVGLVMGQQGGGNSLGGNVGGIQGVGGVGGGHIIPPIGPIHNFPGPQGVQLPQGGQRPLR